MVIYSIKFYCSLFHCSFLDANIQLHGGLVVADIYFLPQASCVLYDTKRLSPTIFSLFLRHGNTDESF